MTLTGLSVMHIAMPLLVRPSLSVASTKMTRQSITCRSVSVSSQSINDVNGKGESGKSTPRVVRIKHNVITEEEERALLQYLDKLFARKRYGKNHFDSVITGYKETELGAGLASSANARPKQVQDVLDRVSAYVCRVSGVKVLIAPHVIDLAKDGIISPHVDSVKFSGNLIAGLSLQSLRVMRLSLAEHDPVASAYNDAFCHLPSSSHNNSSSNSSSNHKTKTNDETNKQASSPTADTYDFDDLSVISLSQDDKKSPFPTQLDSIDIELPPRSLYFLQGPLRYLYTHEILKGDQRRLSVMFRDEYSPLPSPHTSTSTHFI